MALGPFADEQAFWVWAMDPYAAIWDQDEDLLLHEVELFDLLLAVVDRPHCPKLLCLIALDDFALEIVLGGFEPHVSALSEAAGRARRGKYPPVRAWAAYVDRLFEYCLFRGPVNRARAAAMAADLFAGPVAQRRRRGVDWVTVRSAAQGRLWECTAQHEAWHLYINRRSGAWRKAHPSRMTAHDLAIL
ncbi:hypothetical protein [Actinoplanes sp. URMC 104]|uniref:hypothetical protein n=1 Tax=Actinoplanes sp. URMC 104 TaxID=3423409 RepID=UPI003F1C8608